MPLKPGALHLESPHSPPTAGTHKLQYNERASAAEIPSLFFLYIFRFSLNFTFHPVTGSAGRLLFLYNGRWWALIPNPWCRPPMSMLIFMQECTKRFLQKCFLIALKILFKCPAHTCRGNAAVATHLNSSPRLSSRYLWNVYWFLNSIFSIVRIFTSATDWSGSHTEEISHMQK